MTTTSPEHGETNAPASGHHWTFDDNHDPRTLADWWYQESHEGLVLFLVFYTRACRWSRCLGCNLPSLMSSRLITYREIMAQIDQIFSLPEILARKDEIRKVIISNNGSVLDEDTFSSTALIYLVAKINLHLSNLAVMTMETRPEYVDTAELEFLARALKEGDTPTMLELAVGFEAFNDQIRNDVFDKGLSLAKFERFVEKVIPFGYHIKCYFMQKPVPGMSDEEAVADIKAAIEYLGELGKSSGLVFNMHINPTYAARGTPLEDAFQEGRYQPPLLMDVARAVAHARDRNLTIYIGLFDEGLACEGGSFVRPGDENLLLQLAEFNRTQNYSLLVKDDNRPATASTL